MKLIGGPYNGREIEDSGAVIVRMALADADKLGMATYEPNQDRTLAFWVGNEWHGKKVGEIEGGA